MRTALPTRLVPTEGKDPLSSRHNLTHLSSGNDVEQVSPSAMRSRSHNHGSSHTKSAEHSGKMRRRRSGLAPSTPWRRGRH